MAENSKIEWTDHTFNPWMGCTKVSPACKHCYAERDMDHRYGKVAWGPSGTRVLTSDGNWNNPLKWNRDAATKGIRPRVFCASLADVFEDWKGPIVGSHGQRILTDGDNFLEVNGPEDDPWRYATMNDVRARLFELIDATPNLDWLLLTKRPENVLRNTPFVNNGIEAGADGSQYRPNVWLGTSVENQEWADKRIPELLKCRELSPVLFLSCEPLLDAVDLRPALWLEDHYFRYRDRWGDRGIDWVIAGGESGPNARPTHPDWCRSLRDHCKASGIPFHFKQWGEWLPMSQFPTGTNDLRGVEITGPPHAFWARVGKKAAGRLLDGEAHDGVPAGSKRVVSINGHLFHLGEF